MIKCEANYSIFLHSSPNACIFLLVYVDDIITGNDEVGIHRLKQHLSLHFQKKYLRLLKYFLAIRQ